MKAKAAPKKRAVRIVLPIVLVLLLLIGATLYMILAPHSMALFGIERVLSPMDYNGNGLDDYTDFVLGARIDAENHPTYDARYWDTGYPPDDIGVCSDVCWRAFRAAGYSLRDMIDRDIERRPEAYPHITKPDSNIDFRRCVNLKIFFDEYAVSLTLDPKDLTAWQPGDLVIFGDASGKATHFGLISDKRSCFGIAFLIHNGGQPLREENALERFTVIGHYRFDASLVPEEMLIPWTE